MGFFDGITKTLFGGSDASQSAQSGWALLPPQIQQAFTSISSQIPQYAGAQGTSMFTPMGRTADEQRGYSMLRSGVTPTEQSLRGDIAMTMNPFDDSVINEINRQGQGEYSLLKQALNEAGQLGSNRQMLSANDIDLTRLDQIGRFKQDQYNKALSYAMDTLPGLRMQDAQNLLGIGSSDRELDMLTKQAPVNNLVALSQILGILPQSGGSTSQGTSSSQNGIFKSIGL